MGNRTAEGLSAMTAFSKEIASDIFMLDFQVVNAFLVGDPQARSKEWALVDTGLENSGQFSIQEAKKRFGAESRPKSIILTHGHSDHAGSVKKLSEYWDVPVYVHPLEMPYVTGKKDYPAGDPATDEGMAAKMPPSFPHTRMDIGFRAVELPKNGSVPGMPGWCWVHTPGHTEGHVSLFRERDGMLIAGDALATTMQEALLSMLTKKDQINGPPEYMTMDWKKAKKSVCMIHDLDPCMLLPGHGQVMKGDEAKTHLKYLIDNFDEVAIPGYQPGYRQGR